MKKVYTISTIFIRMNVLLKPLASILLRLLVQLPITEQLMQSPIKLEVVSLAKNINVTTEKCFHICFILFIYSDKYV